MGLGRQISLWVRYETIDRISTHFKLLAPTGISFSIEIYKPRNVRCMRDSEMTMVVYCT